MLNVEQSKKAVVKKGSVVYTCNTMAKRIAVNTKNKTSRSKKTKKRLAAKHTKLVAQGKRK